MSRRVKGSHGREEARILLAKAHEKVTNQRNHFLHRVANKYVAKYGVICVEDLDINAMARINTLPNISMMQVGEVLRIIELQSGRGW